MLCSGAASDDVASEDALAMHIVMSLANCGGRFAWARCCVFYTRRPIHTRQESTRMHFIYKYTHTQCQYTQSYLSGSRGTSRHIASAGSSRVNLASSAFFILLQPRAERNRRLPERRVVMLAFLLQFRFAPCSTLAMGGDGAWGSVILSFLAAVSLEGNAASFPS